jgi:ABC-type multidrug transport system fused ATPase/permease subunit
MSKDEKQEVSVSTVSISTDEGSATVDKTSIKREKKGKKPKAPMVSMFRLFRFATTQEKFMILAAIIFSAGSGALQPVSILIYGQFITNLTASLNDTSTLLDATLPMVKIMAYMGTASLIAAYVSNCLWILTGESQTRRIRSLYLHSVLNQDMGWFDAAEDGSLNTRLASDTQIIQDGISEKFGQFVQLLAQFVAGLIVAFIKGSI